MSKQKPTQFPTQSDITIHVGVNAETEIKSFKEKYFRCLKQRVEFSSPEGDKNKLYECTNATLPKLEKSMEKLNLSEKDKIEIKIVKELMYYANVNEKFREMFSWMVEKGFSKEREELIHNYIAAQQKGRDLFDNEED
jgi:hypothetical protein